MEREQYPKHRQEVAARLDLPEPAAVIALPNNLKLAYIENETKKLEDEVMQLEKEASELQAQAAEIKERIARGDVLPKSNYTLSPEQQASMEAHEEKSKSKILGLLHGLGMKDGDMRSTSYIDYHDMEFSSYTNNITVSVIKHQGGFYISNDVYTTYNPYSGSKAPTQSAKRIIIHGDLKKPLVAGDARSFQLDAFEESRQWFYVQHDTENVIRVLRNNEVLESVLALLGDAQDPTLDVTQKSYYTEYTRSLTGAAGVGVEVSANYSHGERSGPDKLRSVRIVLKAGDTEIKQYRVSADALEMDCYEPGKTGYGTSQHQLSSEVLALLKQFM